MKSQASGRTVETFKSLYHELRGFWPHWGPYQSKNRSQTYHVDDIYVNNFSQLIRSSMKSKLFICMMNLLMFLKSFWKPLYCSLVRAIFYSCFCDIHISAFSLIMYIYLDYLEVFFFIYKTQLHKETILCYT